MLGRIASNVTGGAVDPRSLPPALEQLASNSPISRVLTSARRLTGPLDPDSGRSFAGAFAQQILPAQDSGRGRGACPSFPVAG